MLQLDTLTGIATDLASQVQVLQDRSTALEATVQAAIALISGGDQQGAIDTLVGTLNQAKEHLAGGIGSITNSTQELTDAVTPPQS